MGLLNVLINRLETSIKDLKESHSTKGYKTDETSRIRDDDDIEMSFPKRVKMEFTPPRYIPVSLS